MNLRGEMRDPGKDKKSWREREGGGGGRGATGFSRGARPSGCDRERTNCWVSCKKK